MNQNAELYGVTSFMSDEIALDSSTRPLWTEDDLAKALKKSKRTLQAERQRGTGIPFLKLGRSVRYDPKVVEQYLRAQTRVSTFQTEAQGGAT
jgi:AraC-like DNA-binding protein